MSSETPKFSGVHLFVRDMQATLRFYALLGLEPSRQGEHFANIDFDDGNWLQIGTYALTKAYDPGWSEPVGGGTNALQFTMPSREAVDEVFARIVEAGYEGRLAPWDAYWGARYAEVVDPDGNVLGFHSPSEDARRSRPPI